MTFTLILLREALRPNDIQVSDFGPLKWTVISSDGSRSGKIPRCLLITYTRITLLSPATGRLHTYAKTLTNKVWTP